MMPIRGLHTAIIPLLGALLLAISVRVSAEETFPAPATGEGLIKAETLMAQIKILAAPEMEGRASGTPGGAKAAAHITEEFRKLGLQPIGDNGSYLQSFEVTTGVRLGAGNRLALVVPSARKEYQAGVAFQPFSLSTEGEVSGEVVFAGYGITAPELNYDDYAGLDVRDRIVLVMTHEPQETLPQGPFRRPEAFHYTEIRYKVINAREHGAKGIILVIDPNHPQAERARLLGLRGGGSSAAGIIAINALPEVVEAILAPAGKRLNELQQTIDHSLRPCSFTIPEITAHVAVNLIRDKGQTANVIGMLPGRDPKLRQEALVIGAHYDHLGRGGEASLAPDRYGEIHPGADDNASGVAGVIALAGAFTRAGAARSLVFAAFAAEEMGLLGSSYYVKQPPWPLEKTYAMINLDAVGRLKDKHLYVLGVDSAQEFRALLQETAKPFPLTLRFSGDGFGPSDHASFYIKGRSVLSFFTGSHIDYHRPSDTPEKVNAEGLATLVRLVFRITATLAQADKPLTFVRTQGQRPHSGRGVGYGAYFGSIPEFSESPIPGMKLAGVRPESPAEKAGLKAGDIIIRFAGMNIRSVEDLVFVLRSRRAGDQVELVYLRDGQTHQAQATLEPRH